MPRIKNAIIAAAGMGKRLGLDMPKCLVPLNKKTLIEYQLELLKNIENVYMIVGFRAEQVIEHVSKLRKDVIFVINHAYATTQTLHSLQLAAKFIKEPYIFTDGDLYINPESFERFLSEAGDEDLIGITAAKSEESVYVELNKAQEVIGFTREGKADFEWLGLAYFKNINMLNHPHETFVFDVINKYLPLKSFILEAFEIDTIQDFELMQAELSAPSKRKVRRS